MKGSIEVAALTLGGCILLASSCSRRVDVYVHYSQQAQKVTKHDIIGPPISELLGLKPPQNKEKP